MQILWMGGLHLHKVQISSKISFTLTWRVKTIYMPNISHGTKKFFLFSILDKYGYNIGYFVLKHSLLVLVLVLGSMLIFVWYMVGVHLVLVMVTIKQIVYCYYLRSHTKLGTNIKKLVLLKVIPYWYFFNTNVMYLSYILFTCTTLMFKYLHTYLPTRTILFTYMPTRQHMFPRVPQVLPWFP